MTYKFFIEDIKTDVKSAEKNFNTQQNIDIDEIKKKILEKLSLNHNFTKEENIKKKGYVDTFNDKIIEYFDNKETYNNIYIVSDTSSYSSDLSKKNIKNFKSDSNKSDSSKNNPKKVKNIRTKKITEIEIDLFLKNIQGEKIINFLNEMKGKEKLIEFCKKFTIDEKEQYNVCIEITIDSKDILSEKIPQLFKMTSCFNFLYNTNQFFKSIEDNSLINDSYSYFKKKTKFINYDKKLILLTISNGNINNFKDIQKEIEDKRNEKSDNSIKYLDNSNKLYNIYFIYYKQYRDDEIENMSETIRKQNKTIDEQNKTISEINEKFIKERNELNNQINELREKLDFFIKKIEEKEDNEERKKK